jgi:glyoxylase-like metal-dependent hydrolase (beta-lactamase superfamily II)
VILRPYLFEETACASYLIGCLTTQKLAVVDPHVAFVEQYLADAERMGTPVVAVFETHVQADHVSGLPELVQAGATAYLPENTGVEFAHEALADGAVVELGNTVVRALATPGHAPAHHAYIVSDWKRKTDDPWIAFTGDSLLVGDVGRPDLHAGGRDPLPLARTQYDSMQRLLELPDGVLLCPSHYAGSVCGRTLSGNPFSTIGFERQHNRALDQPDADAFAAALLQDMPPPPADQAVIVAANRRGAVALSR